MKLNKLLMLVFVVIAFSLQSFAYNINYKDYSVKNQWYIATFDETGSATVFAAFNLFNKGFNNQSLDVLRVEIPRGNIEVYEVVQALTKSRLCNKVCAQYDQVCIGGTEVICTNFNSATNQCASWQERCRQYSSECVSWTDQCYEQAVYNNDYNSDFKLLDKNSIVKNDKILEIPIEEVAPGETSKVILKYKYYGGTSQGLYSTFSFETLKVPVLSENAKVVIKGDANIIIKGTKSQRSYSPFGMLESIGGSSRIAYTDSIDIKNPSDYQRLLSEMQYSTGYGSIVEERTSPSPGQGILVEGKYADSRFKLYAFEIILGFAVFFALMFGAIKFALLKLQNATPQLMKYYKEFHIWRSIGFSFLSFMVFVVLYIIAALVPGGFIKALLISLSFFALIGVLTYAGILHGGKEVLVAIAFFFAWITVIPFLFFVIMFLGMINMRVF